MRAAQWGSIGLELSAPLIFFVREHRRWLVVAVFLGFHVSALLMGIHFLPTAICWSAFLPWERLPGARRRA